MDITYFDLAKAFDRMSHDKLLAKLAKLSIPYNLLLLIHLFISRRQYKVTIDGAIDERVIEVSCGVPQGSNLGPLLFTVSCYEYDLPVAIRFARVMQYADDTKLMMINLK